MSARKPPSPPSQGRAYKDPPKSPGVYRSGSVSSAQAMQQQPSVERARTPPNARATGAYKVGVGARPHTSTQPLLQQRAKYPPSQTPLPPEHPDTARARSTRSSSTVKRSGSVYDSAYHHAAPPPPPSVGCVLVADDALVSSRRDSVERGSAAPSAGANAGPLTTRPRPISPDRRSDHSAATSKYRARPAPPASWRLRNPPPRPWTPSVGARVVRNPAHWMWGNQDGGGEGVVLGLEREGWVVVGWERTQRKDKYRWGAEGAFDVEPVAGAVRIRGEIVVECPSTLTLDNKNRGRMRNAALWDVCAAFEVPTNDASVDAVTQELPAEAGVSPGILFGFTIDRATNQDVYQSEALGKTLLEQRRLMMSRVADAIRDEGGSDAGHPTARCLWNICWVAAERVITYESTVAPPETTTVGADLSAAVSTDTTHTTAAAVGVGHARSAAAYPAAPYAQQQPPNMPLHTSHTGPARGYSDSGVHSNGRCSNVYAGGGSVNAANDAPAHADNAGATALAIAHGVSAVSLVAPHNSNVGMGAPAAAVVGVDAATPTAVPAAGAAAPQNNASLASLPGATAATTTAPSGMGELPRRASIQRTPPSSSATPQRREGSASAMAAHAQVSGASAGGGRPHAPSSAVAVPVASHVHSHPHSSVGGGGGGGVLANPMPPIAATPPPARVGSVTSNHPAAQLPTPHVPPSHTQAPSTPGGALAGYPQQPLRAPSHPQSSQQSKAQSQPQPLHVAADTPSGSQAPPSTSVPPLTDQPPHPQYPSGTVVCQVRNAGSGHAANGGGAAMQVVIQGGQGQGMELGMEGVPPAPLGAQVAQGYEAAAAAPAAAAPPTLVQEVACTGVPPYDVRATAAVAVAGTPQQQQQQQQTPPREGRGVSVSVGPPPTDIYTTPVRHPQYPGAGGGHPQADPNAYPGPAAAASSLQNAYTTPLQNPPRPMHTIPAAESTDVEILFDETTAINITLKGRMDQILVSSIKGSIEPYTMTGEYDFELDGVVLNEAAPVSHAGIYHGCRLRVLPRGGHGWQVLSAPAQQQQQFAAAVSPQLPPTVWSAVPGTSGVVPAERCSPAGGRAVRRGSTPPPKAASPYGRSVENVNRKVAAGLLARQMAGHQY